MNFLLKTMIINSTLVLASASAQEMPPDPKNSLVKLAIQQDIDHFKMQFRISQGGTRTAEDTISSIRYKLTVMKLSNYRPFFAFECDDREIQDHFAPKIEQLNKIDQ